MARPGNIRMKVLRLVRQRSHRYDLYRAASMSVSIGLLLGVPLSGLARVDFWAGHHRLFFREASLREGLAGVIVGIAAMYVVTFLSNVVAGRMFCGWGCPVGQVSRFGEAVDTPGLKRWGKVRRHIAGGLFSGAFVVAMLAWWVDLRMLWQGSPNALTVGWGLIAVGIAGAYLHGRFWRWEFCKAVCPIGLYYSFVSPAKWYGVYFRNQHNTCIDCDACDNVCPVDLFPRDLMAPMDDRPGFSVAGAPGRNHCLECGDCIRACEKMIELRGEPPVPLLLGYHRGPQRVVALEVSAPSTATTTATKATSRSE